MQLFNVGEKQTVVESKSATEQPQHHLLVKIAEEFCDEGERLALYLDCKMPDNWDSDGPKIEKITKLVEMLKQHNKTVHDLRSVIQCADKEKARIIFESI